VGFFGTKLVTTVDAYETVEILCRATNTSSSAVIEILDSRASGFDNFYVQEVSIVNVTLLYKNNILGAPLILNAVFNAGNKIWQYIISKIGSGITEIQYANLVGDLNNGVFGLENTGAQTTATNSIPYNTQKIMSNEFTTGVQKGYINGVNSGANGNYNGALTSRPNLTIGARSSNAGGTAWTEFFKGYINEIVITKDPNKRDQLEKDQKKYYGL
jgi:hypothetical protein